MLLARSKRHALSFTSVAVWLWDQSLSFQFSGLRFWVTVINNLTFPFGCYPEIENLRCGPNWSLSAFCIEDLGKQLLCFWASGGNVAVWLELEEEWGELELWRSQVAGPYLELGYHRPLQLILLRGLEELCRWCSGTWMSNIHLVVDIHLIWLHFFSSELVNLLLVTEYRLKEVAGCHTKLRHVLLQG